MAAIGHSVLGDAVYGRGGVAGVERQLLHAWRLSVPHPENSEILRFEAPIALDMRAFIESYFLLPPENCLEYCRTL
jgi:23S rRNA pseudouridine1911/1915/1917 synthase